MCRDSRVIPHPQQRLEILASNAFEYDGFIVGIAFYDSVRGGGDRKHVTKDSALSREEMAMDAKEIVLHLR
jgi:hypothetical protein